MSGSPTGDFFTGGSLDLPLEEIENSTVRFALEQLSADGKKAVAVRHPQLTISCAEKQALFEQSPDLYGSYGEIRIARGLVLRWKESGTEQFALYINDSEHRVVWKELKWQLHIPKKKDLGPYQGDVEEIVGLPRGGVSPFVSSNHQLSCILFGLRLFQFASEYPDARWDFAFGQDLSVIARPEDVFWALHSHELIGKIVRRETVPRAQLH